MAQNIAAIITLHNKDIDTNYVHFKEDEAIVLVLDIDLFDISGFISEVIKYDDFETFRNVIIESNFMKTFEDETYRDLELEKIITAIDHVNQQSWIIEYYSEWADIPDEHFHMAVIDGKVIHDSAQFYDEDKGNIRSQKTITYYQEKMSLPRIWYSNESRYKNFNSAEQEYMKIISEK